VYHVRTKHIDARFHRIRELVSFGELLLEKVHTYKNAADMLTKRVTIDKFKQCLNLTFISRCRIRDVPTYNPRCEVFLTFLLGVDICQGGDCCSL
jgi:hypothetical protein